MPVETNISPRFGFYPGGYWRRFVANVLGADDSGYPLSAALRAQRRFGGRTFIAQLADLSFALPVDYPLSSGDPSIPDEADLQAHYEAHFPVTDLPVLIGDDGPSVSTTAGSITVPGFAQPGTGRSDVCRLAAARALGLAEIAIEVRWT
jgi:hypothetical protein